MHCNWCQHAGQDEEQCLNEPHLGVLAKLSLKNAKGARPAHIVRHELVHTGPDVLTGHDPCVVAMPRQDLLGHGHWTLDLRTSWLDW